MSPEALRGLAELLAQSLANLSPSGTAVDLAGSNNTVAGRDICQVSARGRGVAVAGNYFEIHLHMQAPVRRKRGST